MADGDLDGVTPDLKVGPTSSFHAYRDKLAHLGAQGRQLKASVAHARDGDPALARLRLWQRDCAATISELSGGRKVHWLSRAFSEALLVPLNGAESASIVTIIDRILNVLDRAAVSLAQAGTGHATVPATDPPRARFTFIEDVALRVHLEEAYLDGRAALSRDESALALVTFGSILETVITGALERFGVQRLAGYDPPPAPLTEWPFATRIAIAERARLISAACARLPEAARQYRTLLNACGEIAADAAVSTREAKLTRDVLHIILRDLAPGR